MLPALIEVALAYHREPLAYPHFRAVALPLPIGMASLVADLCLALANDAQARTARQAGVSVAELHASVRIFLRQVLLAPGADHYRCLGLAPGAEPATIRRHYALLIRLFHPDHAGPPAPGEGDVAARLNAAYRVLREPGPRAVYDATLTGRPPAALPLYYFAPAGAWVWRPPGRRSRRPRVVWRRWLVLALVISLLGGWWLSRAAAASPPGPRAPAAPGSPP